MIIVTRSEAEINIEPNRVERPQREENQAWLFGPRQFVF